MISLRQAQKAQATREPHWAPNSGYVDFVTDDRPRCEDYVRFYVGQSSRSEYRLAVEHLAEIRRASTAALHYFILACGQGHRYANFLRLWHIPTGSPNLQIGNTQVETAIVNNILEMAFCRVFESLPDVVLKEFFGNPIERDMYANVGLNVLPPLLQGQWVPPDHRNRFSKLLKDSSDPEIIEWVNVRAERLSRQPARQTQARVLTGGNYCTVLRQLAAENGISPESITSLSQLATPDTPVDFKSEFEYLRAVEETEHKQDFLAPMGSSQALVNIVIDSNDICVGRTDLSDDPNRLWALRGVKFTRQNACIWTSSFEAYGSGPSKFESLSSGANRVLELNRLAVLGSSARVIVMCGLKAQVDMIAAMGSQLAGPITMSLRDISHSVWLLPEAQDFRRLSRIFIGCPEPDISVLVHDRNSVRGITDVFGLVSAVTGVQHLNVAFFENVRFYSALKLRCKREQNGEIQPMKLDDLDSDSREWLCRRGFATDADILELEKIAGSISRGLLYLVVVLSHNTRTTRPETRTAQPNVSTSRSRTDGASLHGRPRVQDPETVRKMKILWDRVHNEHLERILELRRAQNDHRPVTEDQMESFFEDSLPSVHSLEKNTNMPSDLSIPFTKRKRSPTPDRGQDSAPPSASPKKARIGKETFTSHASAPDEPTDHLTTAHTSPSRSSQLTAQEAHAQTTPGKRIPAPRETQAEHRYTPIPAPVQQTGSHAKDPAMKSSQDQIFPAAENNILEDPVIDLLAEVLGEDENETLTVLAANDRHKMSKTSVQAEDQPKQSLRDGLLNGTYEVIPTMVAKDGHVAWLALSNIDHFPIPLVSTSDNRQVFRVKAHLAKPGTIHTHRILGNTDLYEQSDPALRLAIQYCQREMDSGQRSSWQWAMKNPSRKGLFRMNTLVDVLEGIPTEATRERPRRWWRYYGLDGKYISQYND